MERSPALPPPLLAEDTLSILEPLPEMLICPAWIVRFPPAAEPAVSVMTALAPFMTSEFWA